MGKQMPERCKDDLNKLGHERNGKENLGLSGVLKMND